MKVERKKIYLIVIPLFLSLIVASIFYPGAMSYDTFHALQGARTAVTDSMWPPMVSYIWRVVDLVSFNPSAMHFSQLFLLIFSIYFIIYFFTRNVLYTTIFLLIYLSIPVILGTLAVIWKDVLMAAFFMAGFAVVQYMKGLTNKRQFYILALVSTFILFLGVCTRHNAITGAVPILFYLSWLIAQRVIKNTKYLWFGVFFIGFLLTSILFFTKTLLDSYSLPNFNKMPSSTNNFIELVRVLDVAGASLCVGENLFYKTPSLSLEKIREMYNPKHANLSKDLVERPDVYVNINETWMNNAIKHPICIFSNKFELTKYLTGANSGEQFLLTHKVINDNEYGYAFKKSRIRGAAFSYIDMFSQFFVFKPWFIYFLSIAAFIYMLRIKELTPEYFTLFMSAYFYFSGIVAFGNASDARLLFYTTTTLSIFIFISMLEFKKRHT